MKPVFNFTKFAVALLVLALAACVSMETPKSMNERIAYGYASVAAARNTAASMLDRGRITVEDAKKAQALADQSRAALDIARGASIKGDMKTAQGQLDLALTVLTSLETFLKAQEAK